LPFLPDSELPIADLAGITKGLPILPQFALSSLPKYACETTWPLRKACFFTYIHAATEDRHVVLAKYIQNPS
jgi:hypothetical protein